MQRQKKYCWWLYMEICRGVILWQHLIQTQEKLHNSKSGESAAENGRKGGIKSGEAKRLYKTFREVTNDFLDEDKLQEMVEKLYTQVIEKGDSKAFEVLRDTKRRKANR